MKTIVEDGVVTALVVDSAEIASFAAKDKITQIKHVRAVTGLGLVEAKMMVDALSQRPGGVGRDLLNLASQPAVLKALCHAARLVEVVADNDQGDERHYDRPRLAAEALIAIADIARGFDSAAWQALSKF